MDSFYEQPRKLPVSRTTAPAAAMKILPSLVPDASMLLQNSGNIPQHRAEMSYNAWKIKRQHPQTQLLPNKENLHPQQPSLYRKQVRFESPSVENKLRPTVPINGPILRRHAPPIQHQPKTAPSNILQEKPFEKIYMANIPNRHLDLSIIEPPRNVGNIRGKHIAESTTIDVRTGLIEDRMVADEMGAAKINLFEAKDKLLGFEAMRDYKNSSENFINGVRKNGFNNQHEIGNELNTGVKAHINGFQVKPNSSNTKSNEFEVSKNQYTSRMGVFDAKSRTNNIQTGPCMNQVTSSKMTEFESRLNPFHGAGNQFKDSNNPQIDFGGHFQQQTGINSTKQPQANSEHTPLQNQTNSDEPSVKDLLKIIQTQNEQLMTLQKQVSTLLQDRYEAPQRQLMETPMMDGGRNAMPKFAIDVMTSFEVSIRPQNNNRIFNNREFPKIQEITDDDVEKSGKHDVSLSLSEPLVVQQECPSPEHSIHVDMQDFSSDSDEDTSRSSLIGWTIYNNVMGQVNQLLKKSNGEAINTPQGGFNKPTMQKVKETTLRHLKNVGVKLNTVDGDESVGSDASLDCSPTEISYAVKQLLMKYLPDEHLSKLAEGTRPDMPGNYPKNLIKRRPDFSMATVQYMEKYNLLNKDNGPSKSFPKRQLIKDGKMLDITALKQQPKLL